MNGKKPRQPRTRIGASVEASCGTYRPSWEGYSGILP